MQKLHNTEISNIPLGFKKRSRRVSKKTTSTSRELYEVALRFHKQVQLNHRFSKVDFLSDAKVRKSAVALCELLLKTEYTLDQINECLMHGLTLKWWDKHIYSIAGLLVCPNWEWIAGLSKIEYLMLEWEKSKEKNSPELEKSSLDDRILLIVSSFYENSDENETEQFMDLVKNLQYRLEEISDLSEYKFSWHQEDRFLNVVKWLLETCSKFISTRTFFSDLLNEYLDVLEGFSSNFEINPGFFSERSQTWKKFIVKAEHNHYKQYKESLMKEMNNVC